MKVLQVIDQAFRTTTEEQDDTILWLTQSMRGAGGDLSVLLTGHGCYYGLLNNRQPTLQLGEWRQQQPADISRDIDNLVNSGVPVYVVQEDLEARGLFAQPLRKGVAAVPRNTLPELYEQADQVWHW